MRVTHVITRLIVGGAQENTLSTVLGLKTRHGVDVDLVAGPTHGPEGSLETIARDAGLFSLEPRLVRSIHPWHDTLAIRSLAGRFRKHRPDIVHTHSGKAGIIGRLAAKRARVPVVIHGIHGPSFGPFQSALSNVVFRTAEQYAGRFTRHFTVVADAMKRQYLEAGIGTGSQYTRIFSGFDLTAFRHAKNDLALRETLDIAPDDFVVGKIARLFRLKGHDDLFDAAPKLVKRVPNIVFLLVGNGEWRERFEQLAARPEMKGRFRFTGLLPPEQVPRYVGVMDALAHLSYREGLPRALPQALAAGKPVVAYDCDGAREICRTDETGFLLPLGDTAALAEALAKLAADPVLSKRLGEAGRDFTMKNFSVERLVDEQHTLYQRLQRERDRADRQ
jgi:glycosyltransferase involved in cell wall biosynthesis